MPDSVNTQLAGAPHSSPAAATVKNVLLSTLCGVSRGLDVIEDAVKIASSGDLRQVPFPLVGQDAQIYLDAQKGAYHHVLEMCSADSLKEWLAQGQAALLDEGVLLQKLQEVVQGFDVLEAALKTSTNGDLSQAQFPLVGEEARIHLSAKGGAYLHALEMCDSTLVQALLKSYKGQLLAQSAATDLATKITQIIPRKDGSEVRIVAEAFFGAGLHRSVGVHVHRRESKDHEWVYCNDRPHPDWRSMSVAEYEKRGRSEMLQAASNGEILRAISLVGRPMAEFRDDSAVVAVGAVSEQVDADDSSKQEMERPRG